MTPNKQLQRTAIPNRWRAASASFHYAHAARWTRGRAATMDAIAISKIRIDDAGRLHVIPAANPNKMFRFIYRAAMGVDWDEDEQGFFTPAPQDLSYADWWLNVLSAVRSEMGVSLELEETTVWENVPPAVKQAIRVETHSN